jgi:hypothetical protein
MMHTTRLSRERFLAHKLSSCSAIYYLLHLLVIIALFLMMYTFIILFYLVIKSKSRLLCLSQRYSFILSVQSVGLSDNVTSGMTSSLSFFDAKSSTQRYTSVDSNKGRQRRHKDTLALARRPRLSRDWLLAAGETKSQAESRPAQVSQSAAERTPAPIRSSS